MPHQTPPSANPISATIRGSRHAPLVLAALVFLVTLLITFAAWNNARQVAHTELENNFNYRVRDMAVIIARRMAVYEQVLRGAQGYVRGSLDIEREDFALYYARLKLDEHFPGLEALGLSTIIPRQQLASHTAAVRGAGFPDYTVSPPHERALYTSITHIEPFRGRNLRAFGFDMFSEPERRAAMEAARDTGKAAVTGKVTLVQEGKQGAQSGFVMYLPVFRAGQAVDTVDERRAAILGWVYSPFRMNDLMRGLGGEHSSDLAIKVYDGAHAAPEALLYHSADSARPPGQAALLRTSTPIQPADRAWTLAIDSTPALEARLDRSRPLIIAVTGAGLGLLLSLVVWLLASERRRAIQLAREMTLELRQSHDQMDAEQRRMRVILHTAYDAFIAVDPQGRITDWNAQAVHIFGWTEAEALGKDIGDLVLPDDPDSRHHDRLRRFLASADGAVLQGPAELMARHRRGHQIPVELAIAPLPTGSGYGASAFVRDITPRKEAALREQQRQERLDEARTALQRSQKLEAVGKLTGGVANDFNNILHIISANVQLMRRSDKPIETRLHGILDAVERGVKLTAQLLAFARRQPLQPSVVDLRHLVERMDSLLQRAAGETVQIQMASAGRLWSTLVDPNQLENVLLNLVINARDAMDGKGSVTIRLDNVAIERGTFDPVTLKDAAGFSDPEIVPGEYVTIAVADTGSGMPPEVMEQAFEPFFTTKPEGKGTGLGLSMAHGFVTQSGGHIRLSSSMGAGTTVTIYLPRSAPEPAASAVQ
jgi:PAS domain S-box-containing protein